jgi:ferredoxin
MGSVFESDLLLSADPVRYLATPPESSDSGVKVVFRDGRAFIPIARSGCGVACKYCYIASPADNVVPLSPRQVQKLLESLRRCLLDPREPRPIMAIGCDTEVGVSPSLTNNVLACLDFAAQHTLPVQIATKFPLALELRDALENWPADLAPPMVFTTITTMTISKRLEPNAPDPATRAANFASHLPRWQSYALIKPFLNTSAEDRDFLVGLLGAQHGLDGVVVGVRYRRRSAAGNLGDPHPVARDWIATLPSEAAKVFVRRLGDLGLRVFMNTQCASSWHDPSLDSTIVRINYPHLCVQCGRCPEEERVCRVSSLPNPTASGSSEN